MRNTPTNPTPDPTGNPRPNPNPPIPAAHGMDQPQVSDL